MIDRTIRRGSVEHERRTPDIRRVGAAEVLPLRARVLRRGMEGEPAAFAEDADSRSFHLAAGFPGAIVGVVSVLPAPFPGPPEEAGWRLRGMAVREDLRGRGVGALLLRAVDGVMAGEGRPGPLWANARTGAVGFYIRHGWRVLGDEFDIPPIGPHLRILRVAEEAGQSPARGSSK
ncbi:MAG: GNAT family N-acetyltransferase [Gemmatimonadota bacterium]|jgi:GNAT superfamily N-acetyltransferase|nr:GNAT family N-acetyltransferase [Gemmatimonadota bacterium]